MNQMRMIVFAAVAAAALVTGAIPAAAGEVRLKYTADGRTLTLNADLELAAGKTLADGVVLITHGTLAHKDMEIVTALQDLLAERGLSSLGINLSLGLDDRHGMADCRAPQHHRDADATGEIAAWAAWLKKMGAGPITVLGHSRGGNQTARYAAAKPDPLVKGVVLVAPPVWKPGKAEAAYEARYKKPLMPLVEKAKAMVAQGQGAEMMTGVDFLYCPGATVSAMTLYDYYRPDNADRDTPSVIGRIALPVLAVAGSDDSVNPGFGPAMKGQSQANVTVVVIDGAGHFFRDLYAEDLADAVARFVKGGGA